jgi:hypothetical protein
MTTISPPKSTDRPVQVSAERRDSGRFRTTPGRLRLLSIVSVGAILVLLAVSAGALSSRRSAAKNVSDESGTRLVQVQALYHALADADPSASTSQLATGGVSSEIRHDYQRDLDEAGRLLSQIAEHSQSSADARRAVAVIARELPRYSEKVESARVQTRLGYPIAAQQMRDASQLMRTKILTATLTLYTFATDQLIHDYDRGTSASQMVWIVVIGVATLAVLILTQLYTARRTNRILNVGLVVASVIVAVVLVWMLVRFNREQDALVKAQRNGSDSVQLLSSARILALQAQANANIALAERGTGKAYRDEFTRLMTQLCGDHDCTGGLLAYTRGVADRTGNGGNIDVVGRKAAAFWTAAQDVMAQDDKGDYPGAVALALTTQADASKTLDAFIASESLNSQTRFDAAAHDARSGFAILAVVLILGLLLAGVLVLVGLQPRIGEYR